MKRFLSRLILLTAISFGIAACQSEKTANQPETNKSPENIPVKVLIQNTQTSDCAADGYIFLAYIIAIENKWAKEQAELAKGLSLESENTLTVVEESVDNRDESKKEKMKEKEKSDIPKSNPKDFDFLIKHNVDYKEQRKQSLNQPLKLTAIETWTVEEVSDPSIKTTQTVTYILDAGSDTEAMEKITKEQITKVIIPSLAPFLKEIRAFIESNRKK